MNNMFHRGHKDHETLSMFTFPTASLIVSRGNLNTSATTLNILETNIKYVRESLERPSEEAF